MSKWDSGDMSGMDEMTMTGKNTMKNTCEGRGETSPKCTECEGLEMTTDGMWSCGSADSEMRGYAWNAWAEQKT